LGKVKYGEKMKKLNEIIKEYLSELGKRGGSAKTEKKAKASRENGKRPKKKRKP
jgi:hypothetical protein